MGKPREMKPTEYSFWTPYLNEYLVYFADADGFYAAIPIGADSIRDAMFIAHEFCMQARLPLAGVAPFKAEGFFVLDSMVWSTNRMEWCWPNPDDVGHSIPYKPMTQKKSYDERAKTR